jgi:hypothetical protein
MATHALPRPGSPRSPLWPQLRALLRARLAVSREERLESPLPWYLKNILYALVAVALTTAVFVFGFALGRDDTIDSARATVVVLLPGMGAAVYLFFSNLQSSQSGHLLGEAFILAPLPRLRFGLLRTLDSLLQAGNAFIFAITLAPWLGIKIAGGGWLNGWAALAVPGYACLLIGLRELLLAIHRYVLEATRGLGTAIFRVAFFVLMFTIPIWAGVAVSVLNLQDTDPLSLPLLERLREPLTPLVLLAGAAALVLGAVWVRARPTPQGFVFSFGRSLPHRAMREPVARAAFEQRNTIGAMLRMMLLQSTRRPIYRYQAGLLLVFSVLSFIANGAGSGFVVFLAFVTPMSGMYNLYGADAPYYTLWLGSGRTLSEWTLARQLFFSTYFLIFATVGAVVVFASRSIPLSYLPGAVPLIFEAPLLAMLIGPAVSRFVITSHVTEISQRKTAGRSSRSFISPLAASATAVLVAAPGAILIFLGIGLLNWLVLGALAAAVLTIRPHRADWTPPFRTRLAQAFRS